MKIILLCVCVFFTTLVGYCASENNEVYLPTQLTTTSSWNYEFYFNAPFLPPKKYSGWQFKYQISPYRYFTSMGDYILSNTYFIIWDYETILAPVHSVLLTPGICTNNQISTNNIITLPCYPDDWILKDIKGNTIGYSGRDAFESYWWETGAIFFKKKDRLTVILVNDKDEKLYLEKPKGQIEVELQALIPRTNYIDVVWSVLTDKKNFYDKGWRKTRNVLEIKHARLDPVKWQWLEDPVTVLTHDPNKEKVSKYEMHCDFIENFACHIQDTNFTAFFLVQYSTNYKESDTKYACISKYYWLNKDLNTSKNKQEGTITCMPVCIDWFGYPRVFLSVFDKAGNLHIIIANRNQETDFESGRPIEYRVYQNSKEIDSNKMQMPALQKGLVTKYRNIGRFYQYMTTSTFMYYNSLKDAHILFDKQNTPYLLYISYEDINNKLHAVVRTLKLKAK